MRIQTGLLKIGNNKRYCLTSIKLTTHAPAYLLYAVLADYRHYYPLVIPKCSIDGIDVCNGGKGVGTTLQMKTTGWLSKRTLEMRVDEPVPGSVIVLNSKDESFKLLYSIQELGKELTNLELSIAIRLVENGTFVNFMITRMLSVMVGLKHLIVLLKFIGYKRRHVVMENLNYS